MILEPTPENIERAATILLQGGLVAFPTETVYGLGANALDPNAVSRIYTAKGRPSASPLIVHVADVAMARALTSQWPPAAEKLAESFWPGPLTIVLKKANVVPDLVTAGLDSVGIRVPAHALAQALIKAAGIPIAAPSANLFTQISPTTAQHVEQGLGSRVDIILDGGQTSVGIESTVVSLRRVPPMVLRPGMIPRTRLEHVTGIAWEEEIDRPHLTEEPLESPGQHPRHYSPRTPFYVLAPGLTPREGQGKVIRLPSDPASCAHDLYAELHRADHEGWDWIAVEKPPETAEWTGILDRLKRASFR